MVDVSIVLPTYNRKEYLKAAIDSVLSQETKAKFEIIVIDDLSTDGTEDYFKTFDDPRVIYEKLKIKKGGGGARNRGIEMARGRYVAFIDSDVEWDPGKLEKQINALDSADQDVGVVYTQVRKQNSVGSKEFLISPNKVLSGYVYENIMRDNFIDTPASLVKVDILRKVGLFDERLPRFQDWELFMRICKNYKVIGIDQPLITSLCLSDSISENDQARLDALEIILQKHFCDISENDEILSRFLVKIVNSYYVTGRRNEAVIFMRKYRKFFSRAQISLLKMAYLFPKKWIVKANRVRKIFRG